MHMLQSNRHIDEDVPDVLLQDGIRPIEKLFQVGALHILHQTVRATLDLAVLDITDDVFVIMDLRENLAPAQEPALGNETKP